MWCSTTPAPTSSAAGAHPPDRRDYELFFKSYASLWRCKTDYINEMRSTEAEHPLNFLRTNVTLQQFEKFYETFDIGPGDGMYLAPEDRIPVW